MSNPSDFRPTPSGGEPPPLRPQVIQPRSVVGEGLPSKPESEWKKIFAPIAALGVLIAKFFAQLKFLILPVLKFLPLILKSGGSMFLTIGVYAMFYGWKWAAGFVVLIFVHECGHLLVAQRFGLKVTAPVFIPFMGAFILLKDAPRNAWMEACVGIGGPALGAAGGLLCHALGLYFDSPLLISLAYTTYFLNLFNLIPLGQLDGGHIATALSPWLWLPGLAAMAAMAFFFPSFIVILILILSIPRVISLFRQRTEAEQRYFEVTPAKRATMAMMYFALIGMLIFGMYTTHQDLLQRGPMQRRHEPAVAINMPTQQANGLERF